MRRQKTQPTASRGIPITESALASLPLTPVHAKLTAGRRTVSVELPRSVVELLEAALRLVAVGKAWKLVVIDDEMSTQSAADLLGVSRPFLVKLIDRGDLPGRRVGARRRVRAADVIAYRERTEAEAAATRRRVDELIGGMLG